jgi:hypothetical protein
MDNSLLPDYRVSSKLRDKRRANSYLQCNPDVCKILGEAHEIANHDVRVFVLFVINAGLDNADDSAVDSYGDFEKQEFPYIADYWRNIFYGSAASMTCENFDRGYGHILPRGAKRGRKWLAARGIQG